MLHCFFKRKRGGGGGEFAAKMVTNTTRYIVRGGLVQPQNGGLSEREGFSANKNGVQGNKLKKERVF